MWMSCPEVTNLGHSNARGDILKHLLDHLIAGNSNFLVLLVLAR